MKSLLSKDEKTKLLETFRSQGIIIRKAGIEIEMPSFDASSLKETHGHGQTIQRKIPSV